MLKINVNIFTKNQLVDKFKVINEIEIKFKATKLQFSLIVRYIIFLKMYFFHVYKFLFFNLQECNYFNSWIYFNQLTNSIIAFINW